MSTTSTEVERGPVVPVAIAQMFSARIVAMAMSVGGMAVLARLLTPSDFGTFAFGLAVFGVAQAVSEFGLTHNLVRREDLGHDELRSAAGLALTLASGIGAVAVVGLVVAGRIDDVERAGVVGFLAAALVAEAVAMPYEARRQRAIAFRLLAGLAVGQAGIEVGIGIALALAGLGPTALAAGLFASRAANALLLIHRCPPPERPWPTTTGWRRFGRFGSGFVVARMLPRLGELTIVAMITRGLGVRPLGLYNRSGAIYSIPDRTIFEAINPVILPALAKVLRGTATAGRVYVDKVDYLAAVCWPAFGAIAVMADPLVQALLGSQWIDAIGPVRILALAGLFMPFTKMSMKLFVAVDRIDIHLKVQAGFVAATVVGAAVGSFRSLDAVCAGLAFAQVVHTIGVWVGVTVAGGERLQMPWPMIGRSLVLTAATIAPPLALTLWSGLGNAVIVVVATLLGSAAWVAALVVTRHRLLDDLRGLINRRPSPTSR